MDTASNDAGQAPSHVILDGTDDTAVDAAPAQQNEAPPETEKPQDPDAIVLELSKVRRQLDARERALAARERGQKPDPTAAEFASLKAAAKTDPYGAGAKLAALLGLDPDDFAASIVSQRAGGEGGKLSPEQKVERLEARLAQEAKERETREAEARQRDQEAREAAALAGHINDLKGLAAQGSFPLVQGDTPDELEANVREAFDLMVLAHNAGKRITHINALHMVEKELRETSERRAAKLGYQKTGSPPPQRQDSAAQWAQQPNPRSTQPARPAPIEAVPSIRSDDDIAADWEAQFGERRR
jgi:predicted RNase H-like HicB family nuclease